MTPEALRGCLETYAGYGMVYLTSYKRQGGSAFRRGLLFYLHNGGKTPGTDYRPSAKLSPQRGRVGRDAGGTPGLPGDPCWIRRGLSQFLSKSPARGKEKVECFAALHFLVFPAKPCYNKATKRRGWQAAGGCLKSYNLLQKPMLPIFSLPPLPLAKNLPHLF